MEHKENVYRALTLAIDSHSPSPTIMARFKPQKNGARNAAERLKSVGENTVVDRTN